MTTAEIEAIVKQIMGNELNMDTSELNSQTEMDGVDLRMKFEEEFDVVIPTKDAENFQTIGDAVEYIDNLLNG